MTTGKSDTQAALLEETPGNPSGGAHADALLEETPGNLSGDAHEDELEKTGTVASRHGRINWWLWAVYVIMLAWAVYYAIEYWSLPGYNDLGPGLGDY